MSKPIHDVGELRIYRRGDWSIASSVNPELDGTDPQADNFIAWARNGHLVMSKPCHEPVKAPTDILTAAAPTRRQALEKLHQKIVAFLTPSTDPQSPAAPGPENPT